MATRWKVVAKFGPQKWGSIYVHWDGYPEGAMPVLAEYDTPEKVLQLIELGDCSSISEDIEDCEPYSKRGEDCPPSWGRTREEALANNKTGGEEYIYTWDGSKWEGFDVYEKKPISSLEQMK